MVRELEVFLFFCFNGPNIDDSQRLGVFFQRTTAQRSALIDVKYKLSGI